MLDVKGAFSSFAVSDIGAARKFYGQTLRLDVSDVPGMKDLLQLALPGGAKVLVYGKPDHAPAAFTVLNFEVASVEREVDALVKQEVRFEIYQDGPVKTDAKGISRAPGGPTIAPSRPPGRWPGVHARRLPPVHPGDDRNNVFPALRRGVDHPSMVGRVLVPAGAVLCCLPFVSTGLGLLLGLVLALAAGNPYLARTRKLTPQLLALSVVGLGAGMDLRVVARVGAEGVVYTVAGIAAALAIGALLTRLLGVGRIVGTLISVGTAICGGSAIAAVVPVLRAKDHESTVALATVFLLNAIALFVFPPIGHALSLDDNQFGLWAALAIHDTSSVVGAAVAWGGKAVEIATTVKLARALWIVPLTIGIAWWHARTSGDATSGKAKRPWFIAGFLLAAALATYVPGLQESGAALSRIARQALVVTLFFLGANLTRASLAPVGFRPLLLGVVLWALVASVSLGAVLLRAIA